MALLDDLGSYLDTQVASLTLGTNLFLGRLPDSPDSAVALYEYAGEIPVSVMGGDALPILKRPRIQVLSRASTYSASRSQAITVWLVLEGILDQTINGTLYQRVEALQSVFPLERDTHERSVFVQNYRIIRNT